MLSIMKRKDFLMKKSLIFEGRIQIIVRMNEMLDLLNSVIMKIKH